MAAHAVIKPMQQTGDADVADQVGTKPRHSEQVEAHAAEDRPSGRATAAALPAGAAGSHPAEGRYPLGARPRDRLLLRRSLTGAA